MKPTKISFKINGKKINLDVMKLSSFEMGRGLTFRRREKAPALLFQFDEKTDFALTALFVFFPFYAVWLDKDNKVIEYKRVKPFVPVINIKEKFYKIVEVPCNKKYDGIVKILDGGKRFKKM